MRQRSSVRKRKKSRPPSARRPEIILRIPGPWKNPQALADALPDGIGVRGSRLVLPDDSSPEIQFLPADRQFPDVFAMACGDCLSSATRRAIDQYAVNACLVAPAGSLERARAMMTAGAAVLKAGGYGVFLDTGVIAHEREAWLDMTLSADAQAPLAAFVNVIRRGAELVSIGMHVFGLRDAVVAMPTGRSSEVDGDCAGHLLRHFLEYLLVTCGDVTDGATFGTGSAEALVRDAPPLAFVMRTNPAFNPYGRWRIEPRSPNGVHPDGAAA